METNYELVKEIIENYEYEDMMEDFLNEFEEGEDICKEEFVEFCSRYIDDMSETRFIKINWEYIKSGGDESVWERYA